MSWRDAIGVAVRSLRRRKGRAALTVGAVALAAALLTALLTIATTARDRVLGQLARGGPISAIAVQGAGLDDAAIHRILALPGVKAVAPVAAARVLVVPPAPPVYPRGSARSPSPARTGPAAEPGRVADDFVDGVVGVDLRHPGLVPVTLLSGRLPDPSSRTEVAVTQGYLERVGIGRKDLVPALGTELELGAPRFLEGGGGVWARWTRAVVVGVVAQDAGNGDILAPLPMVRADQAFGDGADGASGGEPSPTYAAVIVEADSLDQVPPVRGEIERIGYSTTASDTLITNVERYIHVIEIVLSAIGIIALAIAGLGIADALFAAVRERRREIGVLKAIGARDRDVRRLFLVEAGLVGAVGGAVGTGMGWASARVVAAAVNAYLAKQGLAPVPVRFPTLIVAGCVLGSACLALLAGVVPAARASRLPASEVMAEG